MPGRRRFLRFIWVTVIGVDDPPAPIVGELLRMDDLVTGFSPDNPKENRPYVVIGVTGRRVRVVPQSTQGEHGVHIADGVVAGLKEGWFVPWSTTVSVRYAASRPAIGHLPRDPYLEGVIAQWRKRRRR
jgi:hypothetical protein